MLFAFACLTLTDLSINGFYYSDDPGANMFGNVATGAAIGGIAGGGRGAAIGAGVGLGLGAMSSAAANNRRRRYEEDRYYNDRYYDDRGSYRSRHSRSRKPAYKELENENLALRREIDELSRKINECNRKLRAQQ